MNTGSTTAQPRLKLAATIQGCKVWAARHNETERKPIGYRNTVSRKYASPMHDAKVPPTSGSTPAGEGTPGSIGISYVRKNQFVPRSTWTASGFSLGRATTVRSIIIGDDKPQDRFPETYDEYFPSGIPGGRLRTRLDDERVRGLAL
jgi:hypothetical protein